ncbi:alpha/beta hydrolase [Flavihumibacter rivuli]|uniref:alpha/beta fold hydrolase n=1 Tax=Flavihumibacter rivuli TaxID=2838156 RepID=UPI001BDE7577|nr:alpha/beta hydrolase [Flavihumibacter rivuli]ULQ56750.1 alpha/beta hydrolase [Flavihumibacter rivuli]
MQRMKVYFIPGLGADKRVFHHIRLPEPLEIVHLEWLKPAKGEPLVQYAHRMAEQINTDEPFSLVGLSFGGMLATEISLVKTPRHTVLISSIAHPSQLPVYYKITRPLQLHRVIPMALFKKASLAKRLFTTETAEDKALLRRIIDESDTDFLRWALGAILEWRQEGNPGALFHIHGTADRLLPFSKVRPTHTIKGAGHLMVMNRADEVNNILIEILTS